MRQVQRKKWPLVPEGNQDALLLGIVQLSIQPPSEYALKHFKEARDTDQLRLIFEFPNAKDDEGELLKSHEDKALTLSIDITYSDSVAKGNLYKFVSAVLQKELTQEQFSAWCGDDANFKGLIGKALALKLQHKTSAAGRERCDIKGFLPLDPDLQQLRPQTATHEPLFFTPFNVDLKEWAKLTFWSKRDVMNAVDASEFPKDLQESWVAAQEAEEVKKQEREAGKSSGGDDNLGAIQ